MSSPSRYDEQCDSFLTEDPKGRFSIGEFVTFHPPPTKGSQFLDGLDVDCVGKVVNIAQAPSSDIDIQVQVFALCSTASARPQFSPVNEFYETQTVEWIPGACFRETIAMFHCPPDKAYMSDRVGNDLVNNGAVSAYFYELVPAKRLRPIERWEKTDRGKKINKFLADLVAMKVGHLRGHGQKSSDHVVRACPFDRSIAMVPAAPKEFSYHYMAWSGETHHDEHVLVFYKHKVFDQMCAATGRSRTRGGTTNPSTWETLVYKGDVSTGVRDAAMYEKMITPDYATIVGEDLRIMRMMQRSGCSPGCAWAWILYREAAVGKMLAQKSGDHSVANEERSSDEDSSGEMSDGVVGIEEDSSDDGDKSDTVSEDEWDSDMDTSSDSESGMSGDDAESSGDEV